MTLRWLSSVYSYWLLFLKFKYSELSFSYNILQYELYRDPDKGNVVADSVITTTTRLYNVAYVLQLPILCKFYYGYDV